MVKKNLLAVAAILTGVMQIAAVSITSPDGDLLLNVDVNSQGTPVYSLDYKGKPLITDSPLGLRTKQTSYIEVFHILGTDTCLLYPSPSQRD